jgi:hypothetical protein
MSIAEKKALAVEKLKALENEVAIDEILQYLEKLANNKRSDFDAKVFFKKASAKYDDVLRKLAQ